MQATSGPKVLIVLLHGYAADTAKYNSLKETISKVYPDGKIITPRMPLSILSCANPNTIVNNLLLKVSDYWKSIGAENQRDLKIILIGHSTGALFARKLYIAACGQNDDAPIEPEINAQQPHEWSKNVDRIILFAGLNRGWTINPHMPLTKAAAMGLAVLAGKLMTFIGLKPVAFTTKRGATFITQLRIQSLSMYKHADIKGVGNALTIQLLGTRDVLVSPEDNIDLVTGSRFVYLDIPFSDHFSVIDMKGKNGSIREKVVKKALSYSESELRKIEVITSDNAFLRQDQEVTDVVFVVHGIRDTGYWTQKIARRVKSIGDNQKEGRKYATETSTYGYFPMLSFLLYPFRRAKVEWLMDQYTENLALYPNASFSFIGHSNGTYLLAKALEEYPACTFKNIVLAGSVVRKNYNWQRLIEQKRIKSIYNFVATNDWVVGIFPKTFQTFGLQDLGSGGYDGFACLDDNTQFRFLRGGHSAAIEEPVWDELVYITVHGKPSQPQYLTRSERSFNMKVLGFISPFIFLLCFLIIITGGILIFYFVRDPSWKIIWMGLYVLLVYKILTWF